MEWSWGMFKCNGEHVAEGLAREHGNLFGMSVFDGHWYVGTADELWKVGIPESDRKRPRIPLLILGRDGIGSDNEADFDDWSDYVCKHIDARAGMVVAVEHRGPHDVQSDDVRGATDEERERIVETKAALWDDWCSEGVPR